MQKAAAGKTTTQGKRYGPPGEAGKRILLVDADADAQANATSWLGIRDAGKACLTAKRQRHHSQHYMQNYLRRHLRGPSARSPAR